MVALLDRLAEHDLAVAVGERGVGRGRGHVAGVDVLVEGLEAILERQKDAIETQLQLKPGQTSFIFEKLSRSEQNQVVADRKHMERRLQAIEQEIQEEPEDLKALYEISLRRLQPVGLVVQWPKAKG